MRVFWEGGICLQEGIKEVVLDPHRTTLGSIVTHAHMDHLTKGALMTPETLAVMKIRLGEGDGKPLSPGMNAKYQGFDLRFHDAGHTFGSVMVEVEDILYTGDFNPEGGLTCGKAIPRACDTLIIESTYGKPGYSFAPKREIERDLLSWAESELAKHPIGFGAIEFGKAQELIALLNTIGTDVVVSDRIADIGDVYNEHGLGLKFRRLSELGTDEKKDSMAYIVPRNWLGTEAPEAFSFFRENGGAPALVSGWCAIYNFSKSRDLMAQFPLSDHADFDDLIDFVDMCEPTRVYTVGTNSQSLAKELEQRKKIRVEGLRNRRRTGHGIDHGEE